MATGMYLTHTRPRVDVATGAEPPWVLCTQAPVRESEDPHPTPTPGAAQRDQRPGWCQAPRRLGEAGPSAASPRAAPAPYGGTSQSPPATARKGSPGAVLQMSKPRLRKP